MGVEIHTKINDDAIHRAVDGGATPLILGLQPSALIDHVARVHCSLLSRIPGEPGGSFPVAADELKFVLNEVNNHFVTSPENGSSLKTIAGGSVANTTVLQLSRGQGEQSPVLVVEFVYKMRLDSPESGFCASRLEQFN